MIFVTQKYQRHNISEDTWQQILDFSRCVNEDLEGYDPRGINSFDMDISSIPLLSAASFTDWTP
jgi:hypothetical protein